MIYEPNCLHQFQAIQTHIIMLCMLTVTWLTLNVTTNAWGTHSCTKTWSIFGTWSNLRTRDDADCILCSAFKNVKTLLPESVQQIYTVERTHWNKDTSIIRTLSRVQKDALVISVHLVQLFNQDTLICPMQWCPQ